MPRAFSTRRFTFAYALIVAVLVALGANLVNFFHLQRQAQIHHQRFESLQHLMLTAYRGLPADQFTPWLARVDFQAWESPGWNLAWLRPDQTVRWSVHPLAPGDLPANVQAAIRAMDASQVRSVHDLRVREAGRDYLVDLHRLSPDDPAEGILLLRTPRPRFFADSAGLWFAAALLFLFLLAVLIIFQQALLGHIRRIVRTSGLTGTPSPGPDQPIETWAEQHVTLASRRISE